MIVIPFLHRNVYNLNLHQSCTMVTLFDVILRTPLHPPRLSPWCSFDPASPAQLRPTLGTLRTITEFGDPHIIPPTDQLEEFYANEDRGPRSTPIRLTHATINLDPNWPTQTFRYGRTYSAR
jgi:hypothetical protein